MKYFSPLSLLAILALSPTIEISAFVPAALHHVAASSMPSSSSSTSLQAGFFDAIFGPKTAEASHILLKGNNASQQCEKLKMDIYKTAMKKGSVEGGVEPEFLMSAVSTRR
jgi:hypothetical protein